VTLAAAHLLTLPGGTRLTARPIRADDKPALVAFFGRLSDESRRRRFLGPKPKLTSRDLVFLTEVDHERHVALVALDAAGAIVAVARYAAWPAAPGRADFAVAVADAWHGRGLGAALAGRLVAHARTAGVDVLTGSTLNENRAARGLLTRLGFRAVGRSGSVVDYELAFRTAALPAAA
jgi:L-amino acid N-acyltransferase YncA